MSIVVKHEMNPYATAEANQNIGYGMARERQEDIQRQELDAQLARRDSWDRLIYNQNEADKRASARLGYASQKDKAAAERERERYENQLKLDKSRNDNTLNRQKAYEDYKRKLEEEQRKLENDPEWVADQVLKTEQQHKFDQLKKGYLQLSLDAQRKIDQLKKDGKSKGLSDDEINQSIKKIQGDLGNWVEKPEKQTIPARPIYKTNPDGSKTEIGYSAGGKTVLYDDLNLKKQQIDAKKKETQRKDDERRREDREKEARKLKLKRVELVSKRNKANAMAKRYNNMAANTDDEDKKAEYLNTAQEYADDVSMYDTAIKGYDEQIKSLYSPNDSEEPVQNMDSDPETVSIGGREVPKVVEKNGVEYELRKVKGKWMYVPVK